MGKSGRVFVRGLTSQAYGLGEFRRRQLSVDRVRDDSVVVDDAKVAHSGDSEKSRTWWRIGPGDEDFLTQTIRVLFNAHNRVFKHLGYDTVHYFEPASGRPSAEQLTSASA